MTSRRHITFRSAAGQTMAEYAVLLALIFLAVVVVLPTVGATLSNMFTSVANGI